MIEKSLSKQTDSEFVCKLCDMMQKYPSFINWDSQGQKMIVFNIQKMEDTVLPQYFRHNNFASFIRQLNMYNFHKLEKSEFYNNDFIAFQHDIFKKGNQRNFHFIQRKKRIKEQEMSQIQFQKKNERVLDKLKDQDKLSESTKQSIQSLLEFKFTSTENIKKIKTDLDVVHRELKDCRSKKITHSLRQIKDKLSFQIQQQLTLSHNIDRFLQGSFLQQKQNKPHFANHIGSHFYPSMMTQDTYPIRDMIYDCNRIHQKHNFFPLPSHCGFFSQMSYSDGSQHPVFYSNPQFFSDLNYQPKQNNGVEKKEEPQDSNEDDQLSMDVVDEEQLRKILNINKVQQGVVGDNLKKEEI